MRSSRSGVSDGSHIRAFIARLVGRVVKAHTRITLFLPARDRNIWRTELPYVFAVAYRGHRSHGTEDYLPYTASCELTDCLIH